MQGRNVKKPRTQGRETKKRKGSRVSPNHLVPLPSPICGGPVSSWMGRPLSAQYSPAGGSGMTRGAGPHFRSPLPGLPRTSQSQLWSSSASQTCLPFHSMFRSDRNVRISAASWLSGPLSIEDPPPSPRFSALLCLLITVPAPPPPCLLSGSVSFCRLSSRG